MKIRIKFSKHGNTRFVGHLDMMRYFQKAMRRADIPIRYSEGFSPHQIMSFAAPLGIGVESDAEYMDISVTEYIDPVAAVSRLNNVMCEGIRILEWRQLPDDAKTAMSQVESADYQIICEPVDLSPLKKDRIPVMKESKKTGEVREVDISPLIYEVYSNADGIFMHIAQGSMVNLKPAAVMEYLGVEKYRVVRKEMYANGGLTL